MLGLNIRVCELNVLQHSITVRSGLREGRLSPQKEVADTGSPGRQEAAARHDPLLLGFLNVIRNFHGHFAGQQLTRAQLQPRRLQAHKSTFADPLGPSGRPP